MSVSINCQHRLVTSRFKSILSAELFTFGALLCRQRCNTIHMWNIASRGPIFSVSSPHPPYRGASAEHVFPRGCVRVRAGRPAAISVKFLVPGICFGFRAPVFFGESSRVPCPPINPSTANPEVLSVTVAHKCFFSIYIFFLWPPHEFRGGYRESGIPVVLPPRVCTEVFCHMLRHCSGRE